MTSLILRPSCPTCASFTFVVRRTSFVLQTWAVLVQLWRRWRLSAIRIVWKMSLSFVTWRWLSSSEAGVSKSCTLMPSIAISAARPLTISGLLRYSFVTGANSRPVFRMCVCTACNTGRKRTVGPNDFGWRQVLQRPELRAGTDVCSSSVRVSWSSSRQIVFCQRFGLIIVDS